jgi:hypothetical protein
MQNITSLYKAKKGITVEDLNKYTNTDHIRSVVDEQIKAIDNKILNAHQAGFNSIEHELPLNFAINNLDKMDAQTIVYSELLMMLKKPVCEGGKGFENTLIQIGPVTKLSITWSNGLSHNERKRRKDLLAQCLIENKQER